MKKSIYYFLTLFAMVFTLTAFNSCREEKSAGEKMEEVGDDIEDGAEDMGDEMEDGAEEVEEEMEDAVDDN